MRTENTRVVFIYNEDGSTTAVVRNRKTNENIFDRTVRLRDGDKPEKIVGRKWAFKKAMNHALATGLLATAEVGALWADFSANVKQKPKFAK